jgi:hypothetical protein
MENYSGIDFFKYFLTHALVLDKMWAGDIVSSMWR